MSVMDKCINLYVFGDQLDNNIEGLRSLMYSNLEPVLDSFLSKSYDAIRSELSRIPQSRQRPMPKFSCLLDLLTMRSDDARYIPLDHALTTIYQIGLFMR